MFVRLNSCFVSLHVCMRAAVCAIALSAFHLSLLIDDFNTIILKLLLLLLVFSFHIADDIFFFYFHRNFRSEIFSK